MITQVVLFKEFQIKVKVILRAMLSNEIKMYLFFFFAKELLEQSDTYTALHKNWNTSHITLKFSLL